MEVEDQTRILSEKLKNQGKNIKQLLRANTLKLNRTNLFNHFITLHCIVDLQTHIDFLHIVKSSSQF